MAPGAALVLRLAAAGCRRSALALVPPHLTFEELQNEMDEQLRFAGIPNIWTMPIKNRIDMLSTGVRTPIGIKILGPDLTVIQHLGEELEAILRGVPGTRNVLAERTAGGYYLDFDLDRDALARYGLSVDDAQTVITLGDRRRERDHHHRGPRALLASTSATRATSATTCRRCAACWCRPPAGAQIPLAQIADIRMREGPAMIRNENGQLAGYVYVDMTGRDIGGYVDEAKRAVARAARPADRLLAHLERASTRTWRASASGSTSCCR